jgi:Zn-finger domain-containing protein
MHTKRGALNRISEVLASHHIGLSDWTIRYHLNSVSITVVAPAFQTLLSLH